MILGVQVVSVYSYIESTTDYCIMRVAMNSHALPTYKKNRIASLLCNFETTIEYIIYIYTVDVQQKRKTILQSGLFLSDD